MNPKTHTPNAAPVPGAGSIPPGIWDDQVAASRQDTGLTSEEVSLARPPREKDLRLPHERDEAPDPLDASHTTPIGGPRQVIEQAASDVSHGLIDTDLHGMPSDVPGPGPAPGDSPGAEVPPTGIDRQSYAHRGEARPMDAGKDASHT